MAQLLCSRGAGSPGQGYGPSGVSGAAVSFVGVSPSAGWGRWVEEASTGAQVGVPGVSSSLATGPWCLLQCRASNTYSQGPDGPLSFQGLRRFGSNRFPMDMNLSKLQELVMDREAWLCCSSWGRKESDMTE